MKTADPGRFVRFRSPRVAKAAGPRVAAFGYFGMGNLGNEGSLAAFLDYMRRTHPEATLSCFAAGAEAVQEEHGIPATQLMSYRTSPRSGPVSDKVRKAASRLWDLPRMLHLMRDVDVLVVPGTGVLERKPRRTPLGSPVLALPGDRVVPAERAEGGADLCRRGRATSPGHPLALPMDRAVVRLQHLPRRGLTRRRARDGSQRRARGGVPGPGLRPTGPPGGARCGQVTW